MAVAVAPHIPELEQTIATIPLKLIDPATDNPRRNIGDVAELAQSIESIGLLEPLVVTPRGNRYLLVCGARRYAAAKLARLTAVPSVVREMDETERILAMAIENLQRVDLSPIEEARAYRQLVDDVGLAQRELATRVGRSQGHISKRLALLELPAKAIDQVDSGGITIEVALELTKLAEHPERIDGVLADATVGGEVTDLQDLAWNIEQELADVAREKKIAEAQQSLRDLGVTVLEIPAGYGTTPKGAIEITAAGGWDKLKLDPAAHADEPCHAAAVDAHGEVRCYCTNRKNHPKLKTKGEATRRSSNGSRVVAREREEQRELAAAKTERREFAKTLLRKRIPQAEVLQLVALAFIDASHGEALRVASNLLELDPPKRDERYASNMFDYAAALGAHAAKGEKQRTAVLLAIAAGTNEEFMTTPYNGWNNRADYVGLLERHGYTTQPIENQKLGRKTTAKRKAA